jgi:hypothetical protein
MLQEWVGRGTKRVVTAAVILLICTNILFFQLRGRDNRRRE